MNVLSFLHQEVPFFAGLREDELAPLAPLLAKRSYKKNTMIFFEGDPGNELYIIKSGSVKIYRNSDSREIILKVFRDGDLFGEMAMLEEERLRSASAETMEACELLIMRKREFVELLTSRPQLMLRLLSLFMERLRRADDLIEHLSFLDVRSRVIQLLLDLSEQHGRPSDAGTVIDVRMTHQQLAGMAGTGREAVTKVLSELQSKNLLLVDRKAFTLISPERLRDLVYWS
ncbi:Crp/Fnr family transcriptional regulator [Paenibacillus sp. HN-1]|uniref:Crp/Fnr family transcriptional regulator n=1 Tax=Paenibacillus TaxID=44249 RepID=UPI001CA8ED57|nr:MULTISPECIES: Crp/Fnr family transcriptional regulator [Paenibacillus]MBY9079093.1 Crp/Fnr family transcriptional regulator [Paenibacillus sp. CGMCC 1.18879]MBY9086871.1 Crp/Fnr family transcriptional regulator [Paenibacillus sinensis]